MYAFFFNVFFSTSMAMKPQISLISPSQWTDDGQEKTITVQIKNSNQWPILLISCADFEFSPTNIQPKRLSKADQPQ